MEKLLKAEYLNSITITTTVDLFKVKCLKCGLEFVVEHKKGIPISAIPCKYCDCAFNVDWG